MPGLKKAFEMMRDDNFELVNENNVLKEKIGDIDDKWLQESKRKIVSNTEDAEKNKVLLVQMQLQQQWKNTLLDSYKK